tara:strand:+ start:35257 stop:36006 length:750 start_codon:yes stop_codon:yes gene_type:complete
MFNSTIDPSELVTIEGANKCFKLLHKGVSSGHINKQRYKQMLDEMETNWPSFINLHFGRRMDRVNTRSLGEFGLSLLRNGDVEFTHAEWWFNNYVSNHFRKYSDHECIGVDQSGILFCEVEANLDYKIIPSGVNLEFKDCGIALIGSKPAFKATFKKDSVDACVERQAYLITVFRMWANPNIRMAYSIATPEHLRVIQRECAYEHRHEMGHKLCYQFFLPEFEHKKRDGNSTMSKYARSLTDYMDLIDG